MTATSSLTRPRPGLVPLVTSVAATVVALLVDLHVPGSQRAAVVVEPGWTAGLPGVVLAWAGKAVLEHDPRHRLGWVLAVFGVWWAVDGVAASWLTYATLERPALPGAAIAFWVYQRLGAGLLLVLPLTLVLYPDGRLPTGRWRAAAVLALACAALLPLVLVSVPSRIAQAMSGDGPVPAPFRDIDLDLVPVPLPDGVWTVLLRAAYVVLAVTLVPAVGVVVHRAREARGLRRTRMRWLLWAAVVDLLVMLTIQLLPDSLSTVGLTAAVVVTAGSVAIGVTRPDIVDIDRLLGTTVQYGVLLVGTLALDVVVLLVTGRAVGDRIDSDQSLVLAVFVVVLLYAPLRHRLSRLVRRWVVGEKDDPYAVVSGLARRLEASDASEEQLLAVAQTVAAAFRSPYVGVELRQVTGELLLAEHGRRPSRTRPLPISYRGQEIGRLLLPSDTVGTRLRAADERLLADVVRQAAAATRATELAAELQRSRERLVTAVEDERRRLRRDLHDGLGPTLAAVASRIDTARITAARSPAESDRVLALARSEVAGLLTDVRRLVHGLRPPALDEVGLVRAVEQHAARLAGPGLLVEVDAPDDLPALPAAVEVAAYRIVAEALTNVVRHAGAARCLVTLDLRPAQLVVEVVDDGVGIEATTPAGVGLLSMRERALELGGRCGVVLSEGGGTRVTAVLPVRAPVLAGSSAAEAAGTREEA